MTAKLDPLVEGPDTPPRGAVRARTVAAVTSVGLHAAALIFFMTRPEPPPEIPPPPESVAVVMLQPPLAKKTPSEDSPPPGPPEKEPASAKSAAPVPAPPKPARKPPRPPEVEPVPAPVSNTSRAPTPSAPVIRAAFPTVSDGELVGAATAGAGQGGGGGDGAGTGVCDMVRRVQEALRRDPDIRATIRAAGRDAAASRALLVWNGSWVQSPGESGKGLAGVRQAIAMEIAFAPAACRAQAMRGLALLQLEDRPGGARLALGDSAWRWSDLLETGVRR